MDGPAEDPEPAGWSHRQAVVGDVRLHYVEAGDPDGPVVLLLHGFPELWFAWRKQLPALADAGYRAVAPDMRGYNRSEKPPGVASYRMDRLVGDALGLVEHLGADSAAVVGHDWGGVVAWEVAARHPAAVDRLAVLNAPHLGRYRELLGSPAQLRRSWYVGLFQLPWLPEALLGAGGCRLVGRLLREDPADPAAFDEAAVRRYREALCRPGARRAAVNYYRALFREWARARLGGRDPPVGGRVDVPTLLVWGERDRALDVRLTEDLDRWVPDCRVERLPGASHWVQNDAPGRVNDLLVDFLGRRRSL